ncbi:uncharacterized protein LOC123314253 isoform X2 [Coccinella septempunctata]|uniref:uncharacterized protein LOC123314253 isoform X2 n=1 Tax=Coccinella septempunctata TaxID=41139 RepID=UPI001D06F309|nr:uncharacterized protein LOC123314253 isoform X2 [Coccinella septempunctata]
MGIAEWIGDLMKKSTLQPGVIQPRMAQLETLEAKMASIEVSLSSTPRRKKNGSIGGFSLGSSIRSIPKEIATKELENLRNALRDKENIIQTLKGQLTIPGIRLLNIKNGGSTNSVGSRELTEVEKKQAEERLNRLRTDVDNKRLAIKNLKMALERLDITDNIDVRIQQAELEYQLGREELNLLTLLEETRTLQLCLDESNKMNNTLNTLFSCVHGKENIVLVGIEVEFDPKSPKFGAGEKEQGGLWIDWALEETGLCKDDRIIEVNGKIVLTKTRDDLARLLAAAPDPAQMVVLRKMENNTSSAKTSIDYKKEVTALRTELDAVKERAEEAQKAKDGLRSDNLRLTHRISYLEEQVSELLSRKSSDSDIRIVTQSPIISTVKSNQNITNINISHQSGPSSPSGSSSSKDIQVFQKGPQVTALVSNIPGLETNRDNHTSLPVRSKSSLSNVSNSHHSSSGHQTSENHSCHKSHRHKHKSRNGMSSSGSTQTLDQANDKITYRKHSHHHHHYREKDYSSETNSAIEQISRYNKKNLENGHKQSEREPTPNANNNIMDQSYHKATKIVQDLTRRSDVSSYEKHRQKCLMASEKYNVDILKHYNSRKSTSVLDFRNEIHIGPKFSECKSADELNGNESDCNYRQRIHNSQNMKSLDFDSDCNSTKTNGKLSSCNKSVDYTSEPLDNNKKSMSSYAEQQKRPMPPKKPLRLSLHKAQSLQSVDTGPNDSSSRESRKSVKRTYKGDMSSHMRLSEINAEYGVHNSNSLKWNLGQNQRIVENGIEMTGSWC